MIWFQLEGRRCRLHRQKGSDHEKKGLVGTVGIHWVLLKRFERHPHPPLHLPSWKRPQAIPRWKCSHEISYYTFSILYGFRCDTIKIIQVSASYFWTSTLGIGYQWGIQGEPYRPAIIHYGHTYTPRFDRSLWKSSGKAPTIWRNFLKLHDNFVYFFAFLQGSGYWFGHGEVKCFLVWSIHFTGAPERDVCIVVQWLRMDWKTNCTAPM